MAKVVHAHAPGRNREDSKTTSKGRSRPSRSEEGEPAAPTPRPGTASISFGLVTIPVRTYPATSASAGVSFHLLHKKDGVRVRQQYVCPADGDIVPRQEMVKGYEFEKGRYVSFTDEELKALDERATHGIEVQEFVPLASIDPKFFERSEYLGPGRGGEKAFALFVRALEELDVVAVGLYAARGKDYLVALRPSAGRLVMHQLLHADEVRPIEAVAAPDADIKAPELKLARELVTHLTADQFDPSRYQDRVRARIRDLIARKVSGEAVTEEVPPPRAKVIDLMAALKASLEKRAAPRAASEPRTRRSSRSERSARTRKTA